jgi:hypothetical protein
MARKSRPHKAKVHNCTSAGCEALPAVAAGLPAFRGVLELGAGGGCPLGNTTRRDEPVRGSFKTVVDKKGGEAFSKTEIRAIVFPVIELSPRR